MPVLNTNLNEKGTHSGHKYFQMHNKNPYRKFIQILNTTSRTTNQIYTNPETEVPVVVVADDASTSS